MQWIADQRTLEEACRLLKSQQNEYVALDTEFMRRTTYYPKLALIQLRTSQATYLVDPLIEGLDLTPLRHFLLDPTLTKVFHAASQDLEIFHNLWGVLPTPFMDTQHLVMFLGEAENMSYRTLCQKMLGLDIVKSFQEMNWLKRPLTLPQKSYAAQDVTCLYEIFPLLQERLGEKLAWAMEDVGAYAQTLTFIPDPWKIWKRFKKPGGLPDSTLKDLIRLVLWRDRMAEKKNLIPRLIFTDEECVTLVGATSPELKGYATTLEGLFHSTFAPKEEEVEKLLARERQPGPAISKAAVQALRARCEAIANRHQIALTLFARSKDLERHVVGNPSRLSSGWRARLLAEEKE